MRTTPWTIGLALAASAATAAAVPTLSQLREGHRLLIVSGPAGDRQIALQRTTLTAWQRQGEDRDVVTVVLDGSRVDGVSDTAAAVRDRYAVPSGRFALALVGKDGHVAWRGTEAATGRQLEEVIDAMPMRRAGQR